MINEIKDLEISELKDTKFIHPFKLSYKQNGRNKTWEAIRSHNSVAVLLYHTQKNAFLLVKQFRAPVFLNDSSKTFTYELCAG
jgi:UDP-sugar diphosphatase